MPEWEAGIISKQATRSNKDASSGVWRLNNQLRHSAADTWSDTIPLDDTYDDAGTRFIINIFNSATTSPIPSPTSADHAGDFDYVTVPLDAALASVGYTGRIYICVKVTATTWYYNDFCIGAIQITSDDYSVLEEGWSFYYTLDHQSWQDPDVHNLDNGSDGFEDLSDILGASAQSWSNLSGAGNYKMSWGTSTGSAYTGAADGIGAAFSSTYGPGGIFTGSEPQDNPSNFIYTESSGTSGYVSNGFFWMRSPEITLDDTLGDYDLSMLYLAATNTGLGNGMTDSVLEPLCRWFWSSLS